MGKIYISNDLRTKGFKIARTPFERGYVVGMDTTWNFNTLPTFLMLLHSMEEV